MLQYGAAAGGAVLVPTFGFQLSGNAKDAGSPTVRPFTLDFKAPPVLNPVRSDATTDYYQIEMVKARVQILPGLFTEVWGYNGITPGPTIKQRVNRQSVIRFINRLGDVDTSVHCHGMAALPQYDGWANDLIAPGFYKDYVYPNNRAAFIWYHDHAVMETARNTYMGLAGCYIVQDDFELNLPLPTGQYDVPLCIQDKIFRRNGALVFDDQGHKGVMGDVILVNGVPFPRMRVHPRRYRFRILNGSVARSYSPRLNTGQPFQMIGTDAGLMGAPVNVNTFKIGMAERYEFVIDFSQYRPGTQIVMRNQDLPNNDLFDQTDRIMRFDVVPENEPDYSGNPAPGPDTSFVPSALRPYNPISESAAVRTRTWQFSRQNGLWVVNGRTWNPNRIDANPNLGDVEIWRLYNNGGGWFHPVHIHLVDWQILTRNGRPPEPYERGWKDTFYVGENEEIRVITKFGPHEGKYMMHCHNTSHEDHDMMIAWQVGRGGAEPTSAPPRSVSQMTPL